MYLIIIFITASEATAAAAALKALTDGLEDGDPVKASLEAITAKLTDLAAKLAGLEGLSSGRMKRDTTGITPLIHFLHMIVGKIVRV